MAYNAKSQRDYNNKCNVVRLKYTEKETKEYNCGHNIPCDDLLFLSLRFLLIQTNTIPT